MIKTGHQKFWRIEELFSKFFSVSESRLKIYFPQIIVCPPNIYDKSAPMAVFETTGQATTNR